MTRTNRICMAAAVSLVLAGSPALVFAQLSTTQPAQHAEGKGEDHLMRQAHHHLRTAIQDLESASHDFAGHRTKALDLSREAFKEISAGLKYDKAQEQEQPKPQRDHKAAPGQGKEGKEAEQNRGEPHPAMHAALRNLTSAKDELTTAPHDYDGHRAKALDLVEKAIAQVQEGLASAKK